MRNVVNGRYVQEVPEIYITYMLCEKFGWTVEQVENADVLVIEAFLLIMSLEAKRDRLQQLRHK